MKIKMIMCMFDENKVLMLCFHLSYVKEISQLKDQLRGLVSASQEDEVALRRKKKRQETDVEELIQK